MGSQNYIGPPTWINTENERLWLMCDACRDQGRSWYVTELGAQASTLFITEMTKAHLLSHPIVSKGNEG